MSWDEIDQAIESYPPSFENGDERLWIMQSLDRSDLRLGETCGRGRSPEAETVAPGNGAVLSPSNRPLPRRIGDDSRGKGRASLQVLFIVSDSEECSRGPCHSISAKGPINNGGEPEESDHV